MSPESNLWFWKVSTSEEELLMDPHSSDWLKVVFKYPWCKGLPLDQRCDLVFLFLAPAD